MSPSFVARLLSLSILGALLALIWALDHVADSVEPAAAADLSRVDFIADKITALRFGADGQPALKLGSGSVRHIPQDDTTQFFAVEMVVSHPGEAQTRVTATQARTVHRAAEVFLDGEVHLVRDADSKNDALSVKTSRLWVDTHSQLARTDDQVEVIWGKNQATAVGMVADKQAGVVELKSKVRMTYVPKNRPRGAAGLR